MSLSSSASPPPASSQADLDTTAELPVLDPAEAVGAGAPHTATDTWILPPAARASLTGAADAAPASDAAQLQRLEADLRALSAKLHEAQELLANRGERLTQVERARDEAHAAHAAAERRIAALGAELTQRQADAARQLPQLDESNRARAAAERRVAALAEELAQARALVSASSERAAQLQQRVEEQDSASRAQRQALVVRGRAHTAHLIEDLRLERARVLGHFESLQTVECRRLIAEGLVTDLQHEALARDAELGRLTRELAGRDARARQLQGELEQHTARLALLEQQVSSFSARLTQRDAQLREARREAQAQQASIARLQDEVAAGGERARALQAEAEQHRSLEAQQQAELQRLGSERGELAAALEATRAAADAAAAHGASRESALAAERARGGQLDSALAAERQRAAQLEEELAQVRADMHEWGGALRGMQQERAVELAGVSAGEARAHALERDAAEQRAVVQALRADGEARAARVRELEADLYAAAATIERLGGEARGRGERLPEADRSGAPPRPAAWESRHAATDSPADRELRAAARQFSDSMSALPEPAPDGAARLLIRSDGEREVVHVLGRKTSVGRTPDNDLQIEAKYISRHHAVILVGPVHTIIEDLNSTNGVLVNGRRITRQTLKDGDQVVIGRALYRFAVRRASDKR